MYDSEEVLHKQWKQVSLLNSYNSITKSTFKPIKSCSFFIFKPQNVDR